MSYFDEYFRNEEIEDNEGNDGNGNGEADDCRLHNHFILYLKAGSLDCDQENQHCANEESWNAESCTHASILSAELADLMTAPAFEGLLVSEANYFCTFCTVVPLLFLSWSHALDFSITNLAHFSVKARLVYGLTAGAGEDMIWLGCLLFADLFTEAADVKDGIIHVLIGGNIGYRGMADL
jgi:hypothetical protein